MVYKLNLFITIMTVIISRNISGKVLSCHIKVAIGHNGKFAGFGIRET